MPYLTFYPRLTNQAQQLNFDTLWQPELALTIPPLPINTYYNTKTAIVTHYNTPANTHLNALSNWITQTEALRQNDMSTLYNTFYIPKHSGGLRRIDAPKPELMQALQKLKSILEIDLHSLTHNCAHAYVKNRSTFTALRVHQANNSKWFLKLDMKNFFNSCTLTFIQTQLLKICPYNNIAPELLNTMIKTCLLNNGLPQGTPVSPLLTNLIMIPIDHAILQYCNSHTLKYTRYADDLLISSKYTFDVLEITRVITNILDMQRAPFAINAEKTRYGSSSGSNWNLGLMLNKDNNITIGHKQKQRFRATLQSFLNDLTNHNTWDTMDIQVLAGQLSYYKQTEPEYFNYVINKYSSKYNIDINSALKA